MNPNESPTDQNLHGLRYIAWLRCSTKGQVDTSIDDQRLMATAYATRTGMVYVDVQLLDGVSGMDTLSVNRAVKELTDRKRQRDDFDVLLVHDFSRMTRAGVLDASKIEYDLRECGIRLISIMDDVPPGEYADIFKAFKHVGSHQQSKAIALATTRGSMTAIQFRGAPHCHNAPYGTDRLILGPDHQSRFLLHLLADGRQQKLDPQGRNVLDVFVRNEKSGAPNHYRLQRGEVVQLVPGDPDHVAIVRKIFDLHHQLGWGDHLIAKQLNDDGIPAPRGKKWSTSTINRILDNPIYLGRGITNQSTTGRHFKRSADGPKPAERTHKDLANYRQPPRQPRSQADWLWVEQPALREFLPPEIRGLVETKQEDRRQRRARHQPLPTKEHDRHRDSSFILKYRATCAVTGLPLTGSSNSRNGRQWRYYGVTKGNGYPSSNPDVPKSKCPAGPAERLVIEQLALTIRTIPHLHEHLIGQIKAQQVQAAAQHPDVTALQRELDQIDMQIVLLSDGRDITGRPIIQEKLRQLDLRHASVEAQLRRAAPVKALSDKEIEDHVEGMISEMGDAVGLVNRVGLQGLQCLLDLLLSKATINLETREVNLEFRLPSWAFTEPKAICLALAHDSMIEREADGNNGFLVRRCRAFWVGNMYLGVAVSA